MSDTISCRSATQIACLGPVPPRTPARPDAQVPRDLADGPARYGRIASLYFYSRANPLDPAFGFIDLEISLQRTGEGRYEVELYCIGDGYQSGSGFADAPLRVAFAQGDEVLAWADWPFPEVGTGRLDPMTFRTGVAIADADFDRVDRVIVPPATARCRIHLD